MWGGQIETDLDHPIEAKNLASLSQALGKQLQCMMIASMEKLIEKVCGSQIAKKDSANNVDTYQQKFYDFPVSVSSALTKTVLKKINPLFE